MNILIYLLFFIITYVQCNKKPQPLIINTWKFTDSANRAWKVIKSGGSALDAVEMGCKTCEELQCDFTVGFGGSMDENGETTLDAMIMDGDTLNVGAVAGLRRIKNAISVARHVLQYTQHSLLVGDLATDFAKQMGFREESLSTKDTVKNYTEWKNDKCQPNFWINVQPNPKTTCGPYKPSQLNNLVENDINYNFNSLNHDTIGIIAIDNKGKIAAGTSSNGAKHKIPGRVGDSPIPGAGAYADSEIGAAAATGDGDVMMRLLPSFLAVEEMRRGKTPTEAANIAIKRIVAKYPTFFGGVIAANKFGVYGAACNGMEHFPFMVYNVTLGQVTNEYVLCN